MLVAFSVYWRSVGLPTGDVTDTRSLEAGVRNRFARRPPTPNRELLRKLSKYVRRWLKRNMVPLSSYSDTTVETWLQGTSYPAWKKQELRETWRKVCDAGGIRANPKWLKVKSFGKRESYTDWKHLRGINARPDEAKCAFGPIFHLIEKALFSRPEFIKKIPIAERPRYIRDRLLRTGSKYVATDYSSFEALFTREIMEAVEFQLYDYMTSKLPEHEEFMSLVRDVLGGLNICQYKNFIVEIFATRMSGEMCTSLGNGFSNLMFMEFMCEQVGCRNVVGVVEGDDGLFSMIGEPPTKEDFAQLGLIIKAEYHTNLSEASFCGLVFDPEDLVNVTDVRKVLAGFGWTDWQAYGQARQSKLDHLMRVKALSLVHQYPGCPILQSFARAVLRNTFHMGRLSSSIAIARKNAGWWEREKLDEMALHAESWMAKVRPPPMNTRMLVERLYGLTVEVQIELERQFDGWTSLHSFDLCDLVSVPTQWLDYAAQYVREDYMDQCIVKLPLWPRRADYVSPSDPSLDVD